MSNDLTNAFGVPLATLVRGDGCYVWDDQGKLYLDFLGGIAVNALGHAHPALVEAVRDQVGRLGHISNFFLSEPQTSLAAKLVELADLGEPSRVFFTNSGTEANEAAFKMVRLHGGKTGKGRVIALDGAFHGRTMGALALTAKAAYREPFGHLPGPVTHVEPTIEDLTRAMSDDVAGIFIEPIQGEAGVRNLPAGFLSAARQLADSYGALLVADEVQTGIGRTGRWLAHHGEDCGATRVRADIVTLAKGLGGGIPIGAAVAGPAAADLLYPGSHGSTFGGNPLACRAALAVLGAIESEDLLNRAQIMGELLRASIMQIGYPRIQSTSGEGLLIGIHFSVPIAADIAREALVQGLIINAPTPTTVRLAPPLIIGERQIDQFKNLFTSAIEAVNEAQGDTNG